MSQFTLYADVRKGRRPSWTVGGAARRGAERVEAFAPALERRGCPGGPRRLRRAHGRRPPERRTGHAGPGRRRRLRAGQGPGDRPLAWSPHVARRLRPEPVRHELLAARGRGQRRGGGRRPGLRAGPRDGAARRGREAAGGGAAHARARRPRRRGGRVRGDDAARVRPRGRRRGVPRPGLWNAGLREHARPR